MASAENHGRVKYADLRGYLDLLEESGLLHRVKAEVDLKDEIGAICALSLDRRNQPALFFENIRGYPGMPLVSNLLSTTEKLAIAFETEADDLEVLAAIHAGKANPIPPKVVEAGPCQEIVHLGDEVDVGMFPTPWWHEDDGGQYIGTTAGVVTGDPDTGDLNCGMYRVMILDKNKLTAEIAGSHPVGEIPPAEGRHSHGSHVHILKNEARGKNAPIAIAIGMDPLLTYVAGQDVSSTPTEHAEFAVAGAWRGAPVEIVRCKTNDLMVPAQSEIVIEGEVLVNERRADGPHGEATGFYNSVPDTFIVKVNCITHRKNPINYGLICRPLEDYPKFLRSAGLRAQLIDLDVIRDVYAPEWACGRIALVAARVDSEADIEAIVQGVDRIKSESYLASRPRYLLVVDEDCDLRNWDDVMWRLALGVRDQDFRIRPPTSGAEGPFGPLGGSSIVIDATIRRKPGVFWGPGSRAEDELPIPASVSKALKKKVLARWREYGFD